MIVTGKQGYLLFDGDCGICTRLAERARAMDTTGRYVVAPYRRFTEAELAVYGLDYEACDHAMKLIASDGRVSSGPFAVNGFLIHFFPWSLLIIAIYLLFPLMVPLEIAAYYIVARNRHRISRWLGMKECGIGTH